jgi:CheY-like chemotaxis protein
MDRISIRGKADETENVAAARILIADDNATNILVAVGQLEKLGYKADAVSNGAEVLAALERGGYELVLMDCEMPVMDGFEATRRIRRSSQATIPIVAVTANAMADDRERCRREGMDDFLSKPIDMHRLEELLIRWKLAPDPGSKNRVTRAAEHTMAPPESAAIFAGDAFLERLMGDRQLAEIVMNGFLQDFPSLLERLHQHFAEMTPGAVIQAHALKGAAATVSANRLSSVARELELAAGELRWERCRELLPDVTQEFNRFERELKHAGWL